MMILATATVYLLPPAKMFAEPNLARIICFHLPCAFASVFFVFYAAYAGVRQLTTDDPGWDVRVMTSTELGAICAALTMTTGILFSKVQWNAWWQWDPRQTSFLFVLLLLGAALALRAGLGEERRARACAAYAAISVVPLAFLMFVFPRLPQVKQMSFHPTTTIQQGSMDGAYWAGVFVVGCVLALLLGLAFATRVRVEELAMEETNAKLDVDSDGAGDPGVGRPVVVSRQRQAP